MSEIVGSVVAGKYRIKRRIGAGGMGAVYEGEHVEIGKRVAIKVIEHTHAQSSELASRFKREARAASAVESEHIVHVFDVGTDDAVGLYMVMELLSGEDLASRIEKRGGGLHLDDAVNIGMQAARGLAKAHAAGVIHRDLKPANLFLTTREDGSTCVKILDFGISKLVRADDAKTGTGTSALTREGSVMGTPMYMSPQQAQGMPLDARTDVWSLGAVLYEALTGAPPWEARDTYEQMIIQIVTKKPRPLAELAPHVPEGIARVVETALQHDLDARTADAATLGKQLAEAARLPAPPSSARAFDATVPASEPAGFPSRPTAEGGALARSNAVTPPPTGVGVVVARAEESSEPRPRNRTALVAVIGAALAASVIAAVVIASRPHDPPAAGAGLVAASAATPAPPPSASPSASATTTLLPLATETGAPAAASASAIASASAARPPANAPAKPAGKPPSSPATGAAATTSGASRPAQFGAAGVSTAY